MRLFPLASGAADLHVAYPPHRSLSAKMRVLVDALVAHFRTAMPHFRAR